MKPSKKKRNTRVTRTKALRIMELAKEVLKRHGQPAPPYGRRYDGRRIFLRSSASEYPFRITYSVFALSRRENKLVVKSHGDELDEIGYEPWAAKALHELESILVLESLASL